MRRTLITLLLFAPAFAALRSAADEPPRGTIDASKVFDAGSPGPVHLTATPPDPPALFERDQWVFDLRWDRGVVSLLGTSRLVKPAPQLTPRVMGRFAIELYEGPTLIERVRFDFPLLATADLSDAGWDGLPSFTSNLRTRIGVVFPGTQRGTRLELWDRATGRRWSLPWPARESPSSLADAGALPEARDAGPSQL